eukprot:1389432-Prymnesium_polylepis.1
MVYLGVEGWRRCPGHTRGAQGRHFHRLPRGATLAAQDRPLPPLSVLAWRVIGARPVHRERTELQDARREHERGAQGWCVRPLVVSWCNCMIVREVSEFWRLHPLLVTAIRKPARPRGKQQIH